MTEKTCNSCIHFGACSKWTDFPKQCGVPVCASFAQQSEKYLIKENGDILPLTHHSEWISVTERMPKPNKLVLCIWERVDGPVNYGFARYQRENVWYVSNEGMPKVTHWMPLPEPPEMKGGAE